MSRIQLQFTGTVKGIKNNPPKQSYNTYGSEGERSSVDVTFTIQGPAKPRKPNKPWEMERARQDLAKFGGKVPTDEKKLADYRDAEKRLQAATARYQSDVATYEQTIAALGQQLLAYAQLVGLMAVFTNQTLNISLSPADQDMLPGMDLRLIEAPRATPADDEDDDDYDDEEEDDGEDLDDETYDALTQAAVPAAMEA